METLIRSKTRAQRTKGIKGLLPFLLAKSTTRQFLSVIDQSESNRNDQDNLINHQAHIGGARPSPRSTDQLACPSTSCTRFDTIICHNYLNHSFGCRILHSHFEQHPTTLRYKLVEIVFGKLSSAKHCCQDQIETACARKKRKQEAPRHLIGRRAIIQQLYAIILLCRPRPRLAIIFHTKQHGSTQPVLVSASSAPDCHQLGWLHRILHHLLWHHIV